MAFRLISITEKLSESTIIPMASGSLEPARIEIGKQGRDHNEQGNQGK